jgi:hypothetical protein
MVSRALGVLTLLLLALCSCLPAGGARAADWLPPSKELFEPLFADPKEISNQIRWTVRDDGQPVTDVGLGDYLGVVRVPVTDRWDGQLDLAAGVIGRFDTYLHSRDFEVADFTLALPFDFRNGPHSVRFALWHISSHLGDDYIRLHDPTLGKAYTDEALAIYSYNPTVWSRVYAGGARALDIVPPAAADRAQAGFELSSKPVWNGRAQAIFGTDLQWYARAGGRGAVSAKLGMRFLNERRQGAVTGFIGYFDGPLYYEQEFPKEEQEFTIGLRFEIGSSVPSSLPQP